jgi:putative phosphoesterase
MKIVVFSDIHANLPALEAFLKNLENENHDMIFCLGDLVGYNVWPNEVINLIQKHKIPCVLGNHDEKAIGIAENDTDFENYAYRIIKPKHRDYLKTLPSQISYTFGYNNNLQKLLLVHGSPNSNKDYLKENTTDDIFLNHFEENKANVLCFGHTHIPFYKKIIFQNHTFHAINVGSLGKPKDGDNRLCYAVLHFNSVGFEKVEFKRCDYDIEKAINGIVNSPLSNKLAESLEKAY